MANIDTLQHRIGYRFRAPSALAQALTHRSHGSRNNERLEFLGDSVLNFVIARVLYERFPKAAEGQLSRLRANLVRRETLADVARDFDLGEFLIMGVGELRSGGFDRDSILADAVEAIIGAMYFDGGLEVTEAQILNWYEVRIGELSLTQSRKDAKSRLQEYLQGTGASLPTYEIVETSGKSHDQTFVVACRSELLAEDAVGTGASRRIAEQEAAAKALTLLESDTA